MAKEKEARRPFNLKREVKPAALGNLYHCASGLGIRGEFFHNSRNFPGKSPEV